MWQPSILQQPPFSGLSPLSSKIFGTPPPPQVIQFLEGPTPQRRGWGSNYVNTYKPTSFTLPFLNN